MLQEATSPVAREEFGRSDKCRVETAFSTEIDSLTAFSTEIEFLNAWNALTPEQKDKARVHLKNEFGIVLNARNAPG